MKSHQTNKIPFMVNTYRHFAINQVQDLNKSQENETNIFTQNEQEEDSLVDSEHPMVKNMSEQFPGLKLRKFPKRVLNLNFEKDILPAQQKLIDKYGFVKEEINFVMKHKPSFILFEQEHNEGMQVLNRVFVDKKGFNLDTVRTLVVKYPYILGKSEEHLMKYFSLFKQLGVPEEESMKYLIQCPKLISLDLDKKVKEILFIFNLYHKITEKDVIDIFRSFPYLFCCEPIKIQRFMGEFRKYRFSKDQIINLLKVSGGILASKVSNLIGLFDYLRTLHKIKASEVVEILNLYPEFVYQNKKDLLRRKVELLQKYSKKNDIYMRNLIKRHPELFLKSWASTEAKINYIQKQLGRPLTHEKLFPLVLIYNYHGVIKPRCELLKDRVKHFEFQDVFPLTDEQFCLAFDIPIEELEKKKSEKGIRDEKDKLWAYVPAL